MLELLYDNNSPALWELCAAHERAFLALANHELAVFALVALDARRLRRRLGRQDVSIFVHLQRCLAIGIIAAPEEGADPPVFLDHRLSANGAFVLAYLLFDHFTFLVTGTCKLAIGIRRAAKEFSILSEPVNQRLAAFGAMVLAWRCLGLCVFHLGQGNFEALFERPVEISQDAEPIEVLLLDLVELLLHIPRKGDVHYLGEVLVKLVGDYLADVRGEESLISASGGLDVAALL